jgi:GDSL-like Lipase/Acylhydrolase family
LPCAGDRDRRVRVPGTPICAAQGLLPGARRLHRLRLPDQQGPRRAAAGGLQHRYADLFAAQLAHLRPQIATVNCSCPGESTTSFLLPCIWKTSGHALHNDYTGSQLDAALAFLDAHRSQVSPITLSLNSNDINAFLQTCPPGDLACIRADAPAAIADYQARLTSILSQLPAAAPDAEIIVVGAYDPNIGAFAFADPLFTQLNQAQQIAAATVRARFADPFPAFNPQGDPAAETTAICTLTLLCSQGDGHPSDTGYRASPASSGPHQATQASNDHAGRPAARKAAVAWAQNRPPLRLSARALRRRRPEPTGDT